MWADVNDGVGEKMRRWCQKVMVGRWVASNFTSLRISLFALPGFFICSAMQSYLN